MKNFNNKRKILKEQLKDLPFKLGAASIAILIGVAEGVIITSANILEGPGVSLGKRLDRLTNRKTFSDYYEELYDGFKNLKTNNARIILHRLQNKGLIKKNDGDYGLTSLGLKYFYKLKEPKKEKQWDGKWRLITFDIPENIRRERQWLRIQLLGFDYLPLQKSVFIGKQPLDEDIFKEIIGRKLNNFIRIMTIGEIDDEEILKIFG